MSHPSTWKFTALDTWFFRESRPHDSAGGSQLNSLFPPPPRTLAGAIRTLVGDAFLHEELSNSEQGSWQSFTHDPDHPLRQIIGHGDQMANIQLSGPWLYYDEQQLFPVPAFLMKETDGKDTHFSHLSLGQPVACDLGCVRLPQFPSNVQGAKPIEDSWLTEAGFNTVMRGENPEQGDFINKQTLYQREPRLGIARNNQTRTAIDGMLYQTTHIRLAEQLSIRINVTGIEPIYCPKDNPLVRLGGEGRLAEVKLITENTPGLPTTPPPQKQILITLLTHARVNNNQGLPDGFTLHTSHNPGEATCWQGEIAGIRLTIHGASIGKAHREGGWDLANQQPREVESLIPAGSTWYCTIESDDLQMAIDTLHGAHIGEQHALGRGQLAIGTWSDSSL